MTKEMRSLMVVGFLAAVLALIVFTPVGYIWSFMVVSAMAFLEIYFETQINMVLWTLLCYLLTVAAFWWCIQFAHILNKAKKRKLIAGVIMVLLVMSITAFGKKPVWLKQPMEIHLAQSGYVQGIWFPSEGPDFRFWPKHNQGIWITSADMSWNSYSFDRIIGQALSPWAVRPAIVVLQDGSNVNLNHYVRKQGHWEILD